MLYFLFIFPPYHEELGGGFDDLEAMGRDLGTLLSYKQGEIWVLNAGAARPKTLCEWRGSEAYEHEYAWYKPGCWAKFTESETK